MSQITDECVITSCGYISREVYAINDRPRNFYMLGSMGMALAFGLGLAYQRPDLKVVVIQGDGATLMSFGTCVLQNFLSLPNLKHYIINNKCYASTGGQPTCFDALHYFAFGDTEIIRTAKYEKEKCNTPRIPLTCKQIKERFYESICIRH